MAKARTAEKVEDQVITAVAELNGDLRRSFQRRVRELASSPELAPLPENEAWTCFLVKACEAELATPHLDPCARQLLQRILRDSRKLLHLIAA